MSRRALIAVALVALVLVGSGLVGWGQGALELSTARDHQAAAQRSAAASQARLDGMQRGVELLTAAGEHGQAEADRITHSAATLADLRGQQWDTQTTLTSVTADVGLKTGQVGAVAGCVLALDAARDRLMNGQQAATVDGLRAGTGPCQLATAIESGAAPAAYPFDFADPFVLALGGRYLAFATNGPGGPIQVLSSSDGRGWRLDGSALVSLPGWAMPGHTWAPTVLATPTGYAMLYSVHDRASNRDCISLARSSAPAGPYVDGSAGPFICQPDLGRSIDAAAFVGPDGATYVLWKSEGELVNSVSRLWGQAVDPATMTLQGAPTLLVSGDLPWEGGVIEGPAMVATGAGFDLLYSGNHWYGPGYAEGYASCATPLGPCAKPPSNVVLSTSIGAVGPGGASVFPTSGGLVMAYAAWAPGAVGWPNPRRLYLAPFAVGPDGRITVG